MDLESYLLDSTVRDATWARAREIVQGNLVVPPNLRQLIKSGWQGVLSISEFIRYLSFAGVNSTCLLRAADVPCEDLKVGDVEAAIGTLGIRYSTIVMAVNFVTRSILRFDPPVGWKKLLIQMMTEAEIGYRFGLRVADIGLEGGVVAGFSGNAGLGLMFASNPGLYRKWQNAARKEGSNNDIAVDYFGCEPYQVSAFILQQMGFGPEVSIGIACGIGSIEAKHLQWEREVLCWKVTRLWIEALREGRNYPASIEVRNFFPEMMPAIDRSGKNLTLEVLYAEIAKVRKNGSQWVWHLPKGGY